eukprot:m.107788 g.107788  ORF g.107788 m.107788 type:complete len:589 (-) comp9181_c0_seq3:1879-3645(-)
MLAIIARVEVENLPRRELQAMCKERGIKANSKTAKLKEDLWEWMKQQHEQEAEQEADQNQDDQQQQQQHKHKQHKQQEEEQCFQQHDDNDCEAATQVEQIAEPTHSAKERNDLVISLSDGDDEKDEKDEDDDDDALNKTFTLDDETLETTGEHSFQFWTENKETCAPSPPKSKKDFCAMHWGYVIGTMVRKMILQKGHVFIEGIGGDRVVISPPGSALENDLPIGAEDNVICKMCINKNADELQRLHHDKPNVCAELNNPIRRLQCNLDEKVLDVQDVQPPFKTPIRGKSGIPRMSVKKKALVTSTVRRKYEKEKRQNDVKKEKRQAQHNQKRDVANNLLSTHCTSNSISNNPFTSVKLKGNGNPLTCRTPIKPLSETSSAPAKRSQHLQKNFFSKEVEKQSKRQDESRAISLKRKKGGFKSQKRTEKRRSQSSSDALVTALNEDVDTIPLSDKHDDPPEAKHARLKDIVSENITITTAMGKQTSRPQSPMFKPNSSKRRQQWNFPASPLQRRQRGEILELGCLKKLPKPQAFGNGRENSKDMTKEDVGFAARVEEMLRMSEEDQRLHLAARQSKLHRSPPSKKSVLG